MQENKGKLLLKLSLAPYLEADRREGRRPAQRRGDAGACTAAEAVEWSLTCDRAAAVKLRFVYALEIMSRGYSVLMHDAERFNTCYFQS